jgi:hypothetical protein
MRTLLGLMAVFALVVSARGEDKKADDKPVTLKGTICCTKCELGETAACGNAIKVKEGGKDVIYYFMDKGKMEKYHGKICQAPAAGSVTGVVTEKDKKKWITPAKDGVKFD